MNTRLDMKATVPRRAMTPAWQLGDSGESAFARCGLCGWSVSCESLAEAGARAEVHALVCPWARAARRQDRRAA